GAVQNVAAEPPSGSNASATSINQQPSSLLADKRYILAAIGAVVVVVALAAYHFGVGSRTPNEPAKITQLSHWDKPMDFATLSPDCYTVAFISPLAVV